MLLKNKKTRAVAFLLDIAYVIKRKYDRVIIYAGRINSLPFFYSVPCLQSLMLTTGYMIVHRHLYHKNGTISVVLQLTWNSQFVFNRNDNSINNAKSIRRINQFSFYTTDKYQSWWQMARSFQIFIPFDIVNWTFDKAILCCDNCALVFGTRNTEPEKHNINATGFHLTWLTCRYESGSCNYY